VRLAGRRGIVNLRTVFANNEGGKWKCVAEALAQSWSTSPYSFFSALLAWFRGPPCTKNTRSALVLGLVFIFCVNWQQISGRS